MAELSAAQSATPVLVDKLCAVIDASIPIPKSICKQLVTIFSMQGLIDLFVVAEGSTETFRIVMEKLKWYDEDTLKLEDPNMDVDSDSDAEAKQPKVNDQKQARPFDPRNPKLMDLDMTLDEKIVYVTDAFLTSIVPACINRGRDSVGPLLLMCRDFERLAEKQLAVLEVRPPSLTTFLSLVRICLGSVELLPKSHHFVAVLGAIEQFNKKVAGPAHDLVLALMSKGYYRDRILAIIKNSADMKAAIENMNAQAYRNSNLGAFTDNSASHAVALADSVKVLGPARLVLQAGSTSQYEMQLVKFIAAAQTSLTGVSL